MQNYKKQILVFVAYATKQEKSCGFGGIMDKRNIKTRENIKNTFMKLAQKKGIRNITVKELCDTADINKTTFYRHYKDIPELLDRIRDDIADKVMEEFEEKDKLFSEPESFLRNMKKVTDSNEETIRLFFFEENLFDFIDRLNTRLCELYAGEKFSMYVKMSFLIGGASYAMLRYPEEQDEVDRIIADIIKEL